MLKEYKTFIVGGTFRKKNGKILVQRRSWEMLRLFADHFSAPVFGMVDCPDDETLNYEIPCSIKLVAIPHVAGKKKVIATFINRGLSNSVKSIIDECYAVYVRQPAWECFDYYNYARSKRKHVMASFHGDWADALLQQRAGLIKKCINTIMAWYVDSMFRKTAQTSKVLFCVGKELSEKYGKYSQNVVQFANYLHRESDIARLRDLCTSNPVKVLFVGGLEERKGIDYLITAIAILKNKSVGISLCIVGTGPLKDELQLQTAQAGIESLVTFEGYMQYGPKLLDRYRNADIFVLPSVASEGLAKVLMEAMSQAVPVIATDVGSARHMLKGGECGILVEKRNSSAIAEAIELLINDPRVRSQYVLKGLEIARQSTTAKQKKIIRDGIAHALPEILGIPTYLKEME